MIRSMPNNALFRVEEVKDKERKKERRKKEKRKYYDFKHALASWSGLELARACAIFTFVMKLLPVPNFSSLG